MLNLLIRLLIIVIVVMVISGVIEVSVLIWKMFVKSGYFNWIFFVLSLRFVYLFNRCIVRMVIFKKVIVRIVIVVFLIFICGVLN